MWAKNWLPVVGFPLPEGLGKKELLVVGIIGGFGFTVALFVAGEAFTDQMLQGAAKMGAIMSVCAALIAVAAGRILKVRRMP